MLLLSHRYALLAPAQPSAKRRRGGGGGKRPPSSRHDRPLFFAPAASSSFSSQNAWLINLRSASPPAKAALLTGAYALAAGAALVAVPCATLAVLAPVAATSVPAGWIRLGGMILATFGAQYALAAWNDCSESRGRGSADAFYRASVPSRLALAAALAALVASGQVEKGVLILAILNATGALSMLSALRRAAAGSSR